MYVPAAGEASDVELMPAGDVTDGVVRVGGTIRRPHQPQSLAVAAYLDWLFPAPVVADVALQLQANWMADYRNSAGIVVGDGPSGPTLTIEDSSRVDPWIVRQAQRAVAECTERLAEFSRRDRPSGG